MDTGTDDGFSRQRRNLVIASTFLLIYAVGDLSVDKFNLVLASGTVKNQSGLLFLMWLIVTYFMYRFYTYNKRDIFNIFYKNVKDYKEGLINGAIVRHVKMQGSDLYHIHDNARQQIDTNNSPYIRVTVTNPVLMRYMYPEVLPESAKATNVLSTDSDDGRIFNVSASLYANKLDVQVICSDLTELKVYIQSIFYFIFTDKIFGDKIFPYLFFYFASSWYLWSVFTSTATQTCP